MKKNKNKKLPLVSVILNCYNSGNFLKKSINSVIAQSYKNWELIVYDNCSTDNTKKEMLKFRRNKKIKYFKSKNFYSLYNARNLAIKKTKGSIITFLDADDWWLKNKLKEQVKILQQNKSLNIIYSNLFLFDENRNKTSLFSNEKLYNGKITQSLLNNFKMPILTTMIKKKIFLKHSFEKKYNIIGDFDLFVKLSLKEKIISIQKPLAVYRIHSSNMTTKKIGPNIAELEKWILINSKKKYFKKYNFSNLKKVIQTLKVKKHFMSGNIIKAFKELFKKPINFLNLKYIYFLLIPKNTVFK